MLVTNSKLVAGALPLQHETVRVSPIGSRGSTRGDDPGFFISPRSAVSPRPGSVDVQVNLEYMQGCQRAHTAWLNIPVTAPFRYAGTQQYHQVLTACLTCSMTDLCSVHTTPQVLHSG